VNTGSDIAKEAADIILLKKDLSILADGIIEGRKTFANITKYILNTVSANYGNMFTLATSSLFLTFIPLLPKQILLNNFISDVPLLAIASDKVDSGFVKKPKKWNIDLIGKFMIYFGLISSLFDLATILPLIVLWHTTPEIFRTAWFVESSLSEILITFSIRTQLPFYKSRPSSWLFLLSFSSLALVILLPFLHLAQDLFSFAILPVGIFLWIGIVLTAYFIIVEGLKRYFFRRFTF
jgi:Mg2+-importing ATPase